MSDICQGHCVEVGDGDKGQPRILLHATREQLSRGPNIAFQDCAVIRTDELESAEVVGYDGPERTITLRFDLMPCARIGDKWIVRPNPV